MVELARQLLKSVEEMRREMRTIRIDLDAMREEMENHHMTASEWSDARAALKDAHEGKLLTLKEAFD